nr:integrase, catalytic region, zinc finger, CCHC-type, peptidase aspartic, catalytic [Tanacetum cinerariifolium]
MFELIKELTVNRTLEKVLIKEEARNLVTKNVNSISLVRTGEERSTKDEVILDDISGKPKKSKAVASPKEVDKENQDENATRDNLLVEIVLFIIDSGCSKHMTGNLKLLINFVEKFMGTVKFRNDQIAPILGYGDLVQGAVTIKKVYYLEGLNHNLFSVGQFCDADLEVAFRKSTCYIRDLKGNDLLIGSRGIDLYSITLQDTNCPNPICVMAKATSSQTWLWHHRLSHLNFDTINLLSKNDIVVSLPKLKFIKDHLCSSCEMGKAKRKFFHTKTTPISKRRLQLLHMELCGPMQTLHAYFAAEGILHQMSVARTPKQNGVVERRNQTLVEAARTMLGAAKVPLFFWAEAIATTCFTQNRSLVIPRHEKTPYRIINDQKPSVKFFYIFSSHSYIVRDGEHLDKMKEKETIHVNFDELPQMVSDHVSFEPAPECQRMALEHGSLSPDPQCQENVTQADKTVTTLNELDLLFSLMFDELLNGSSKWKSRIKRYIDTKPNHELIHHCLKNPPYKFTWADKEVPISEGSPDTRTESQMETYKTVSQDIRDQLNAEAEAVQIILTGIDNDTYSTVDACSNAQADWRDDTDDDELEDQELEAHYMYMAQLQEVSPDAANSGPIFDAEPLQKVSNDDHYNVFSIESEHPEQSESVHDTYPIEQYAHNVIIDSLDISYDREEIDQNDDDNDLSNEREIEDFKNKNKSLESSNNRFKEANNKLSKTNNLLYTDFKKSEAELVRRNSMEYDSKMEIECAQKEAQIKLYKTRKDKELDKVIALENKVKVLDNTVYKTGQSVQTMNMLNNKCRTSFAKHEFLKKSQRANPRLYDIGCYNDNLALMLTPESDDVIRLEKESRSKLSDLIKPFDYDKLNNLYDLFVPQCEKSSE